MTTAPQTADFDLVFLDLMIPHHVTTAAMASVAAVRADHAELRKLAQEIASGQTAELAQMRTWRKDWYGAAPPRSPGQMMAILDELTRDSPGMGGMPGARELIGSIAAGEQTVAALCTVSSPLDRAFLDAMIPRHDSAILLANAASRYAKHPEVAELARAIVHTERSQVDAMTTWRQLWYGGTPPAGAIDHDATVDVGRMAAIGT